MIFLWRTGIFYIFPISETAFFIDFRRTVRLVLLISVFSRRGNEWEADRDSRCRCFTRNGRSGEIVFPGQRPDFGEIS